MKRSLLALALATAGAIFAASGQAVPSPQEYVNDAAVASDGFPKLLSEYRFFDDMRAQKPVPHVYPYQLNTPLYSDGADKLRFVYRAAGTQFTAQGEGLLDLPVGSALIKTFAFGEGDERRLIETRVLLHRADGWVALPYKWNDEQTEAKLALAGGRIPITRPDGQEISYRIPNKNQCKTCHSKDGEVIPIGPKARNLSSEWLSKMVEAGHIDTIPKSADTLPRWEGSTTAPTANAARAYLDVNCAHCHQPGGSASNSGLDLRWEQDDPVKLGIRKPPVAAGRGAGGFLVSVEPGAPEQSIMIHRMGSIEPGIAMPELGKGTIDPEGLKVVTDWILEMGK